VPGSAAAVASPPSDRPPSAPAQLPASGGAARAGGLGRELLVSVAVLTVATTLFWMTRLDLATADLFRSPCCSWPWAEQPFFRFIYRYGVLSGVLLAAGALVVLTLSYWYPARLLRARRPALFLVLVVAVGPGLLVNVVFKDHYGRPRPREVVELGGEERFLPVWVRGADHEAKSFPCGHCSMGFYLATPYLILRRRRRALALAALSVGLFAGLLLGLARMMAGGHFLSDVVWAGGMVWLVALGLYSLLGVDHALVAPLPLGLVRNRLKARVATVLGGGSLALLTLGVLLATPYFSSKTFARSRTELAAGPEERWEIALDEATVAVGAGPDLWVSYQVRAFGFPTSRLGFGFREADGVAVISLDQLGWFTERRTSVRVRVPADGPWPVRIRLGKGRLTLDLRGFSPQTHLDVEVAEGEVRLIGAKALPLGGVRVEVVRGRVLEEPAP